MFFRKSMILIRLLGIFVQEFDSKSVAMCVRKVGEPAVRSDADPRAVAGALSAAAAR